jgi:hypothetical protein
MAAFFLGAVKERNNLSNSGSKKRKNLFFEMLLVLWSILWSGVEEVIVLLGRENHNP